MFLSSCVSKPANVEPVQDFELSRYLGKWYEIARLDHKFERGLSQISAEYSLREDGGVKVVNRGFDIAKGEWKQSEGKAYFVEDENTGFLKVSFFGPFYGSYIITELDKQDYSYALISGPDTSYLWILSRTPKLEDDILQNLIQRATDLGFATEELIFVEHK